MPSIRGSEEEQYLYRWYSNVIYKCLSITEEREQDFKAMVERNSKYMVNGVEYAFYRKCDDYKVFIDENMELPSIKTNATLYNWFHKNYKGYTKFEDRRKGYFEDLISYIESYGFVIHN